MLRDQITDARAWTKATAGTPRDWHTRLTDACVAELEGMVGGGPTTDATDLEIEPADAPITARELSGLRRELSQGRGFGILEGIDVCKGEKARRIYWVIGQLLGTPIAQNIQDVLMYDVSDKGGDVSKGARFSITNAESTFHTDGGFFQNLPDVIGLLCLRTAVSGGTSQLISAFRLHNEMLDRHPEALPTLYEPFLFDRRGQHQEGEPKAVEVPVFDWNDGCLTMRYLRAYIDIAHKEAGIPFTPKQSRAIECLEQLLHEPAYRTEFTLTPGQVLFTNNHWILHNRTAFEDHPDPARRRHYIRLWLEMG